MVAYQGKTRDPIGEVIPSNQDPDTDVQQLEESIDDAIQLIQSRREQIELLREDRDIIPGKNV